MPLGGLGDTGKNLYVLEINNKLIILDSGLQHPTGDLLGVDALVPDISYLESRKMILLVYFISCMIKALVRTFIITNF